ncbi:pancreatic lipase-related protein 2-like [Macrobrachium nipponense]|uniref:pancreatic lipase-related protein 2-like n=1 Tax=Macrobrachium nipponense TaxID=159736 RepID=UPI0030C7C59B
MKLSLTLAAALMAALMGLTSSAVVPQWRAHKGLNLEWNSGTEKKWCDDVLGCLTLNDDWYWPSRPINVLPDSRRKINTRFILHTREERGENKNIFISANKTSVDASTFDLSKPIKFITHGFIDTGFCHWLTDLANAFLDYGDYNVIRVDWGGGSLPMYFSATANTRVVGLEIAHLVNFLVDNYGVDPAGVHLLGHSLGAHASGYAGERIAGLGRITGLDPAGPYFTNTPAHIRIDHTDALFVDNIHSDADTILLLGYGTEEPMGNVDFYPNSGHGQPGCDPVAVALEIIKDLSDGVRDLVACSHQRAIFLFADSLKKETTCPYLARECIDYASFETGRCATCGHDSAKCARMGIHADEYPYKDRTNVKMYFDTAGAPPYCYYHYQIVVDTAHPHKAENWVQGNLRIWLYGENGEVIENVKLTKEHERFDHGQPKYFMLKSPIDLSRVIRLEVRWSYDSTLTHPGSYCWMLLCNRSLYLRSVRISPMDYYPEENRLGHESTLCRVGRVTEVKSGHTQVLTSDGDCVYTP